MIRLTRRGDGSPLQMLWNVTPSGGEERFWRVIITEWALQSYLDLKKAGSFTRDKYRNVIRPAPSTPRAKPRIEFDRLDDIVKDVLAHKRKLRELIDKHGGVSAVARKAGIPQPSLSRLLSSASMPRRSTLYRIANALDIQETEIVTDWVR